MRKITEHKARQIADMTAASREKFEHKARQLADIVAASSCVPNTMCNDGIGDYNEERSTCSEAVYRIECPQKSRWLIRRIIGKIECRLWHIKRHIRSFFGR